MDAFRRRSSVPRPARRPAVAWLLLLLLFSHPAGRSSAQAERAARTPPSGLTTDVREVRYEVSGSTAGELRTSMVAEGPGVAGKAWYGYTTWHVRWRYHYEPADGGCRIDEAKVRFRARMRLPRWETSADVEPGLPTRWHALVAALRDHEEGHRDIGEDAARSILDTLRSFRTERCDGLSERADSAAHEILDEYRRKERRYDRETEHGTLQGAVWPPPDDGR